MFEKIVCLSFMEFLQRLPFKLVNIMWISLLSHYLNLNIIKPIKHLSFQNTNFLKFRDITENSQHAKQHKY